MRLVHASLVAASLLTLACSRATAPAADGSAPASGARATDQPPASASAPPPLRGLPPLATEPARPIVTDLAARIAAMSSGELRLDAGEYVLTPAVSADTGCPACAGDDWATIRVATSYGLRIHGEGVRIVGAGSGKTVLRTRSGVGIAFDGCRDCVLEGVTVTGGERDAGDQAADAAVSVRESSVTIRDCVITDNLGAEFVVKDTFVGISGVLVREGGVATIERCRILRCSWDGISVLRGGRATVLDTVVDGVDRAQALTMGGGRGVGIRLATGGEATIERSLVARHDGGIGLFGMSRAVVRSCVVEDSPSWGIAAWGDTAASPDITIEDTAVHRIGACGITLRAGGAPVTGKLAGIRLMVTAQGGSTVAAACMRDGMELPADFAMGDVVSWMTGGPREPSPADVDSASFRAAAEVQAARMAAMPALADSAYVRSQAPSGSTRR